MIYTKEKIGYIRKGKGFNQDKNKKAINSAYDDIQE